MTFGGEIITCVVGMMGLWLLFAGLLIGVALFEDWMDRRGIK